MKRFLFVLILIILIPVNAYSAEKEYEDYLDCFDLSSFENLDDNTTNFLESLGIDDFDYESLTSISISDFSAFIIDVFKNSSATPVKSSCLIMVLILISSFMKSLSDGINSSEYSGFFSTITAVSVSIFIVTKLTNCISICCSTIKVCSNFAYAFFPAFCIIVASAGGSLTSFSVNTNLMILAQGLNYISENIFIPLTNCFLALGICSSLRDELNISGLVGSLKRFILSSISLSCGIFVSILSIKTAVASRADALGLRSVRFAINTVIPVIGSSISEGLVSIQNYSSLIKTSVGIVGIISVFSLFLPSIVEVIVWRCVLFLSSLFSQAFNDKTVSNVLNAFKDALLIIEVILVLSMVTTIISVGILVAARTVS